MRLRRACASTSAVMKMGAIQVTCKLMSFQVKLFVGVTFLTLVSCATVQVGSYIVPGTALDTDGDYYIIFSENDQRMLHEILRKGMIKRGLSATSGFEDRMPESTNYFVEYSSRWQWDITWYLLEFNLRIYNPRTKLLVASAYSLRTSLQRRTPEEIVAETLAELFDN